MTKPIARDPISPKLDGKVRTGNDCATNRGATLARALSITGSRTNPAYESLSVFEL
jgi:hypothetical protein